MKPNTPLFFILYDSIHNSVFDSQVLQPLLTHHAAHRTITIISYEKTPPCPAHVHAINTIHTHIRLVIFPHGSIIEKIVPRATVTSLKNIISPHVSSTIIARGPYAARIALRADIGKNKVIIVQARGLLAEEYRMEQSHPVSLIPPWVLSLKKKIIYHLLRVIEQNAYQQAAHRNANIEAVSSAMRNYIASTYTINLRHFTIARNDIPSPISATDKQAWKQSIRTELHISTTAQVYCYNGSIKPWQCPQETIDFFKKEITSHQQSILLIITQDTQGFNVLLQKSNLSPDQYRVISVPHTTIYRYLAAADVGIVLRTPHIVNWVSRPTKVLEYQATGLNIVHNNTIDWLTTK